MNSSTYHWVGNVVQKIMNWWTVLECACRLIPLHLGFIVKLLSKRGQKHPLAIGSVVKSQITVLSCCSGAGYALPPFGIHVFDRKKLKPERRGTYCIWIIKEGVGRWISTRTYLTYGLLTTSLYMLQQCTLCLCSWMVIHPIFNQVWLRQQQMAVPFCSVSLHYYSPHSASW